jgi:type II secretory ATPase GspE/PulE/Tfp pilus assembly ATPase PilB-like protein
MDATHTEAATRTEKRFYSEHLMLEMGRRLVEKNRVSRNVLDGLSARASLTGESLGEALVKEGLVSEIDVLRELSDLTGHPFQPIGDFRIEPEAVSRLQARAAIRYKVMPVQLKPSAIVLATHRVPTVADADSLRMLLDTAIEWVLCTESDITRSVKHFYGLGAEAVDGLVPAVAETAVKPQGQDVLDTDTDAGVIRFVNQVIAEAISLNSTDIHIEPFEDALRLRYRIDGVMHEIPVPKGIAKLSRSISSCVKIMAEMDIAERRKPHDGRIKVRYGDDEFDLRVSILPTSYGETVNMRILSRKTMFLDLDHLGLSASQLPAIRGLSDLPHGVILLTGPTGSGKTTTLYAILATLNTKEVKIITVEDPVEYQMHGISQLQVHARIGLTFANILRSILRHDPDIILIGEIRDTETADIAIRSSLTGHLVFSTLHTNDAPSAITRLVDMGVEPYLVSSCLEGVIAQRLVRRVCRSCAEAVTPETVILEEIEAMIPGATASATFLKGHGCPNCNFTGYSGRIALFEIMVMDDGLRNLVVRRRPSNEIRQSAMTKGLITLRHDGWLRAISGMTTVAEVVRVARKIEAVEPKT